MTSKSKVTVVTRFNPKQVGYLDFKYRIDALKKADLLDIVISNIPKAQHELGVSEDRFVLIPGGIGSLQNLWLYFWKIKRYCSKNKKSHVILLHSALAPLSYLLINARTFLYWNEHPSHRVREATHPFFSPVKVLFNKIVLNCYYRGARKATIVMPIGEHHLEDLLEHGCQSNKVRMVYMGVSDIFKDTLEQQKIETSLPIKLIYTGSVKADRGRDIMLEAVACLNKDKDNVHLTIVGASDEDISICNKAASSLGISDSVNVIGRVKGSEIPKYLWQSDLGICLWADKPYWRYNPPTKLFEYLVAGLPVVANDMPTHVKYIDHKKNGLICKYDTKSMVEAVEKLIKDKDLLRSMKEKAKDSSDLYLWSNIEPDFIKVIE